MSTIGKIFIIPCTISEDTINVLPESSIKQIHRLDFFVVERARTARRFLKSTQIPKPISALEIVELETKDGQKINYKDLEQKLKDGTDIGLLSEAGCPGVADPGSELIGWAQNNNFKVVPLVGPSSILLAIMSSGLNGQSFRFNGYLPIKEYELKKKLVDLEREATKHNCTQIFIETPYRNDRMFQILLNGLSSNIRLCVASGITGEGENIQTKTIKDWKKKNHKIGKVPTVFLLGK